MPDTDYVGNHAQESILAHLVNRMMDRAFEAARMFEKAHPECCVEVALCTDRFLPEIDFETPPDVRFIISDEVDIVEEFTMGPYWTSQRMLYHLELCLARHYREVQSRMVEQFVYVETVSATWDGSHGQITAVPGPA
jgi:hypothetical protein